MYAQVQVEEREVAAVALLAEMRVAGVVDKLDDWLPAVPVVASRPLGES